MKIVLKIKFCVFVCLLAQNSISQDENAAVQPSNTKVIIPEFGKSLSANFKLPNTFSNNAFKKVFNGVMNFEVAYVQPVFKFFFIGAGGQLSYYDINKYTLPEIPKGNFKNVLGFGEIGFQKYMNERWYYTISLRGGYGHTIIENDNCTKESIIPNTNCAFTEESIGLFLNGNERMSYGLVVSHQIFYFEFNPSWVCKESFSGLTQDDYSGFSQTYTVGFGFVCKLGKIE